jgi:hypothetical protein
MFAPLADVQGLSPVGAKPNNPLSVHVVELAPFTNEFSLRNAFSKFGRVTNVHIMRDKVTRRSMCKGFVKFATEEAGCAALSAGYLSVDGYEVGILMAHRRKVKNPF